MYNFREENDAAVLDAFAEKHNGSLMQTSMWACSRKKPFKMFIGCNGKNEPVLSAVCIERTVHKVKFWCIPCGMLCDYSDGELISQFAAFITKEMKKNRVAALTVDPYIETADASAVTADESLRRASFSFNPDKDNYLIQPSATLLLKLTDENGATCSSDALLKKFEKGVRYSVRIGSQRGLVLKKHTGEIDPDTAELLANVMHETADRVDFFSPDAEFYRDFTRCFGSHCITYLAYYDKKADFAENSERLDRIAEIEASIEAMPKNRQGAAKAEAEKLRTACSSFEERAKEAENLGDITYIGAGISVIFAGMSTCVFGGAKNVLRNSLRCSHYINFERICDSISAGCTVHDMGRLPVNSKNDGHRYNGLYKFKSSFNTEYTEYLGEYTLVADKVQYLLYKSIDKIRG